MAWSTDRLRASYESYAATVKHNTHLQKVAACLQEVIRAEAGAYVGLVDCVYDGKIVQRESRLGDCRCVTCAKSLPWRGTGGMQGGHFVPGREASIVLEETNIAPQCTRCNKWLDGNRENYLIWMEHKHGKEEVERLTILRRKSVKQTREELIEKRIELHHRLKAAMIVMGE